MVDELLQEAEGAGVQMWEEGKTRVKPRIWIWGLGMFVDVTDILLAFRDYFFGGFHSLRFFFFCLGGKGIS